MSSLYQCTAPEQEPIDLDGLMETLEYKEIRGLGNGHTLGQTSLEALEQLGTMYQKTYSYEREEIRVFVFLSCEQRKNADALLPIPSEEDVETYDFLPKGDGDDDGDTGPSGDDDADAHERSAKRAMLRVEAGKIHERYEALRARMRDVAEEISQECHDSRMAQVDAMERWWDKQTMAAGVASVE